MSKRSPLPMELQHKSMTSNQGQRSAPSLFKDKPPHRAVESEKEIAMGKPEQQLLRGTGAEIYERGLVPEVFAPLGKNTRLSNSLITFTDRATDQTT